MINNQNVSFYTGNPPKSNHRRPMLAGPLYSSEQVIDLCKKESLVLWTEKSKLDARDYRLTIPELAEYIQKCFEVGRYEASEWCLKGSSGPWAAGDGYALTISKFMLPEMAIIDVEFYFKFAISKTGTTLLMISNHREGM